MLCNVLLWFIMGATEGNRPDPIQTEEVRATLVRWRDRIADGDGFLLPYAEDAEYVGTTAYFYVKQFGLARFFEHAPDSVERFEAVLRMSSEIGYRMITPSEAVADYPALEGSGFDRIERGCAWHGGTALAWQNTVHARLLDPVCRSVFAGVTAVAAALRITRLRDDAEFREVMRTLTTAFVSDSRWPPAPTSPGRFNVMEAWSALDKANDQLAALMRRRGVEELRSLYSPELMRTQIAALRVELMALPYFGEAATPTP